MLKKTFYFKLYFLLLLGAAQAEAPSFIEGKLTGQLGNQLFIIATTVSLALDYAAIPIFPDLLSDRTNNIPLNFRKIFYHLNTRTSHIQCEYQEPFYHYSPIPYKANMRLCGYFQSEKYFKHHKKEILELFAPHPEIQRYLKSKYKDLLAHPNTVALHVRSYHDHDPEQKVFIQYGKDYYEKAIKLFPNNTLFVVFSNNMSFCKLELASIDRSMIFIEGEHHYHDLYLMSMCKHNIIGNSSFSWWGAYLNPNPEKLVITPPHWYSSESTLIDKDVIPEEWIKLGLEL